MDEETKETLDKNWQMLRNLCNIIPVIKNNITELSQLASSLNEECGNAMVELAELEKRLDKE